MAFAEDPRLRPFPYSPLDPAAHEIRLLRLSPSPSESSAVQATLTHASLKDPPPYTALSYCWGLAATKHMELNGHAVQVSDELHAALQRLRDAEPADTPRLWIDAVCINQADSTEKGHQVQRMGDIYAKAADVLVWLGPGTPETAASMRAMAELGDVLLQTGIGRGPGRRPGPLAQLGRRRRRPGRPARGQARAQGAL